MPQPSKMVVDREKSSTRVQAAGETHAAQIAKGMDEQFGAGAGGHAGALVAAALRNLNECTAAMLLADQRHAEELGDDPAARDERDAAAAELQAALVDTRAKLTALCGDNYARQLGFEGKLADDPAMLRETGLRVCGNLLKLPAPAALVPDYTVNPRAWSEPLHARTERLAAAMKHVAREEREADATLEGKRNAIAAYDRSFSQAANLVSVLLDTVGEHELARKVRPSARKPGQTAEFAAEPAAEPG